jgi:ribosomal-protein-alanine N-acetyltransferase
VPIGYPDPPLADGVVMLRAWRKADLATVVEASRDPYIPKVTSVPAPFTRGAGERWLERQDVRSRSGLGVSLAVVEMAGADVSGGQTLHKASTADVARGQTPHKGGDGEAVGAVVLMHRGRNVYGLGYWLLPTERGRGLASRAVALVVDWALAQPGVAELEALVEPWNEPSVRVVERAGFSRDRLLSAEISVAGREADVIRYVLSGQSPRTG